MFFGCSAGRKSSQSPSRPEAEGAHLEQTPPAGAEISGPENGSRGLTVALASSPARQSSGPVEPRQGPETSHSNVALPCECAYRHYLCRNELCACVERQAAILRLPPKLALRRFRLCPYSLLAVKICNPAKLVLTLSHTHGYGLKALNLQSDAETVYPIIEYTGELTAACESERRGRLSDLLGLTYLFGLRSSSVAYEPYPDIDARTSGGIARYANHSPRASLLAETFAVMSEKVCVFIRPTRALPPQTEVTINYHFNKAQQQLYGFF